MNDIDQGGQMSPEQRRAALENHKAAMKWGVAGFAVAGLAGFWFLAGFGEFAQIGGAALFGASAGFGLFKFRLACGAESAKDAE